MYKGLQVVTFLNKFVLNPNFIMANQAKISSFFSTANKRPLSESNKVTPSKKKKVQGEECQQSDENKQDVERLTKSDDSFTISNSTTTNQYLNDNIGETWYKALHTEFNKPYFLQLIKFVDGEREKGTVYPPSNEVFNWTKLCPIKQVKVVILGQDPYHGPKQAHGLCFSVQQGVKSPPSLVNMYKELSNDIDDFQIPSHGTLNGWAEQGVLLLNACLTVRAHQANSHAGKGWEKLTDAVISWLNKNLTGVVFMLWGSYAQKKGACINQKKHHVLKAVHPSPLSAHRGFLGCKHFSKCNDFLIQQGQTPIDWTHLPAQ